MSGPSANDTLTRTKQRSLYCDASWPSQVSRNYLVAEILMLSRNGLQKMFRRDPNTEITNMTTIRTGEARAPKDTRLYAIGDVHGCLDELKALHTIIADDLNLRPVANHQIIHLGDYVDRGPDSKGCIQYLIETMESVPNMVSLKGNHEDKLFSFLNDPIEKAYSFLTYGGGSLSRSYGVEPAKLGGSEKDMIAFRDRLQSAIPSEHFSFMRSLPTSYGTGDYLFVHAGVRPDVALENQSDHDLMWIRTDFLDHPDPLAKVIVHGHTPHEEPEFKINRINVDTLAYATGILTCVVLEEDKHLFLSTRF